MYCMRIYTNSNGDLYAAYRISYQYCITLKNSLYIQYWYKYLEMIPKAFNNINNKDMIRHRQTIWILKYIPFQLWFSWSQYISGHHHKHSIFWGVQQQLLSLWHFPFHLRQQVVLLELVQFCVHVPSQGLEELWRQCQIQWQIVSGSCWHDGAIYARFLLVQTYVHHGTSLFS